MTVLFHTVITLHLRPPAYPLTSNFAFWSKDQLFFVVAYQNHMSAPEHTLPVYIWFWYGTMQNNMSIQEDSIT